MASKMYNRARMTVTSTGTGSLSLGVAVAGYQTFSSSGAQNNDVVSYTIEDGVNWEVGAGTFNSVAGTLSRAVTQSYNGTSYGTSAISVTTNAQVYITALAADIVVNGGPLGTPSSGTMTNVTGLPLATGVTGTLPVSNGGTGATTLTGLVKGNGASAFTAATSGTDYVAPGGALGTPASGTLTNCTGLPAAGVTGLGSLAALSSINNSNWSGTQLSVANGGTGLTSLTAGYIPYGNGTGAFSNSPNLTFDGTYLTATTLRATDTNSCILRIAGGSKELVQFGPSSSSITSTQLGNGALNGALGSYISFTSSGITKFYYGTADAEGMRIASDGSVGIGTSSPGYKLDLNGTLHVTGQSTLENDMNFKNGKAFLFLNSDNTNYYYMQSTGASGSGNAKLEFAQGGVGTRLTLDSSGKLTVPAIYSNTAGSANVSVDANGLLTRITSSIKYKKDVVTYSDGLNKVLGLRPVTYKSKCELDENTLYGGFIAEEVAESGLEEFIERNTQGEVEAVRYPNMVALMAAAIQELSAKLDAAEARIAALEAK